MAKPEIVAQVEEIAEGPPKVVALAKRGRDRVVHSKWHRDAKKTMLENPDYFVWWYTVKSVGLGAAVAVAAYFFGKSRGIAQGLAQAGSRHE
jgi:hypothetical protein